MFRLTRLLTALLAFTLLAANSASATTAVPAEKPASGLFGTLEHRLGVDALASSDRIDEKLLLLYDFASDFSVAARGTEALVKSANRAINESGLSRAAQKLSSHAQRAGGTFPKPAGSVVERNAQAEKVLRGILESPQATRTQLSRGGFEVRLPNGQGARFEADGSFNTFLDPRL
jgi:hypothetical protein